VLPNDPHLNTTELEFARRLGMTLARTRAAQAELEAVGLLRWRRCYRTGRGRFQSQVTTTPYVFQPWPTTCPLPAQQCGPCLACGHDPDSPGPYGTPPRTVAPGDGAA
jgi:hypothetical protein